MDVKETKDLILRRLGEMRSVTSVDTSEPARQVTPRPQDPPRPKSRGWLNRAADSAKSAVEERLQELEDRLAAVERCYLAGPKRREPARERGPAEQAGPRPPAGTPSAPPPAPAARSSAAGADMDFGGLPYRLTGVAGDGLLTDVLQLLASNQKSGRFSLFVQDGKRFDAYFSAGEIIDVRSGDLQGDSAFFSMMATGQEHGYYGFLDEDVSKVPKRIEGKTQFLILEALRRIDEDRNKKPESEKMP